MPDYLMPLNISNLHQAYTMLLLFTVAQNIVTNGTFYRAICFQICPEWTSRGGCSSDDATTGYLKFNHFFPIFIVAPCILKSHLIFFFYIKTFKIAPTCFDPKIIFRGLHCSLLNSRVLKHLLINFLILTWCYGSMLP